MLLGTTEVATTGVMTLVHRVPKRLFNVADQHMIADGGVGDKILGTKGEDHNCVGNERRTSETFK